MTTRRDAPGILFYLAALLVPAFIAAPAHAGCGSGYSEIAPDAPLGYDFGPACETHDNCYDTCGKSRGECDEQFRRDLQRVCDVVRQKKRARERRAQVYINQAAALPIYRVDKRAALLALAAYEEARALRHVPQIAACNSLAESYYRAVLNFGRGPYCAAQAGKKCCPQNFECVDVYDCPTEKPPLVGIGGRQGTGGGSAVSTGGNITGTSRPVTGTGGGTLIWMGTDQSKFCRYLPENMTPVPVGGGTVGIPTNGGGPGTTTNGGGTATNGGETNGGTATNGGGTAIGNNGGGNGSSSGGTITSTPDDDDDDGDDPSDTGKPQEPTGPPKIYVNIKATSTAVAQGSTASNISGVQIKLYPTAVANPTLPGQGAKDTKTGAGDDPAQAMTGDDGEAQVAITGAAFGLSDKTKNMTVAVNLDPSVTAVVSPAGTPVGGSSTPNETVTVAGSNYWVFYLPNDVALTVVGNGVEINICIIKEPVAPGASDFQPPGPASGLPGATLSLGGLREAGR